MVFESFMQTPHLLSPPQNLRSQPPHYKTDKPLSLSSLLPQIHPSETMAPDLNSVPASPRNVSASQAGTRSQQPSLPSSRRASQIYPMNPPPLPLASLGGAIPTAALPNSGHLPFPPLSPGSMSAESNTGVPIRHPRPMTPAEMHLELEKEQEAIVCLFNPPRISCS